jgi:hypothetical protein
MSPRSPHIPWSIAPFFPGSARRSRRSLRAFYERTGVCRREGAAYDTIAAQVMGDRMRRKLAFR